MAKLYFRYGAMNSGKSTALLQVAHNYEERDMNVILIKPLIDTKGNQTIISRIGANRKADILAGPDMNLAAAIRQWHKDVNKVHCVLVDEAQFLEPAQVDQLLELTTDDHIPVIAYGLRTDFMTNSFPGSRRLLEVAHAIEELKSICRCGRKAIFVGRKINGKYIFSGNQVAIDGQDEVEYESLCAVCYFKNKNHSSI